MSEQAVEDRRGWASDIIWVALYSILVLVAILLWI
jgi:cytoskeletal protein RodZ